MCERVEALLDEIGRPEKAARVLGARLRRGESTPGFGHTLYPEGDPRTPPLIGSAWELAPRSLADRHHTAADLFDKSLYQIFSAHAKDVEPAANKQTSFLRLRFLDDDMKMVLRHIGRPVPEPRR